MRRKTDRASTARVYCIPYAGGGPSAYRSWDALIPDQIDVCYLRFPGRESRLTEPALDDLDELVAAIAEELGNALDLPYAFVGDCSGAVVMLELSRVVRRRGWPMPVAMYGGSSPAPQLPRRGGKLNDLPLEQLLHRVGNFGVLNLEPGADAELVELLEPTLRCDLRAIESWAYRDEAPLAVPLTMFGGHSDAFVTAEELVAWHEHTSDTFTLRLLDAGHFVMTECPGVAVGLLVEDFDARLSARDTGDVGVPAGS